MFGHDWDSAQATIVAREAKYSSDGSGATHTFVADIRLASGETFRATIHEPTIATDFWAPNVRDTVSVLVRGKDRKVKFDKDDERLSVKAFRASQASTFQSAQSQPVGSPPPGWAPTADLPAGVAQRLARYGIPTAGPVQIVSADSAAGQAALAAFGALGVSGGNGVSPAGTTEARLEKLAALHEHGLLSATEYAEQRQRILDEI